MVYPESFCAANYINFGFVLLFSTIVIFQGIRIPTVTVVAAAGHYKETQYRALAEAVINIIVSISLIPLFKIYGILIGTICAYLYRNADLLIYVNKYIIKGTLKKSLKRITLYIGTIVVTSAILLYLTNDLVISNYLQWILLSVQITVVAVLVVSMITFIFQKDDTKELFSYFYNRN